MNPGSANIWMTRDKLRDTVVDRGVVRVPVRHAQPGGQRIELGFLRLESRARPAGPPVIFLTGGPGLSGVRAGQGRLYGLFDALRDQSDVVLFDQRAYRPTGPPIGRKIETFPTDRVVTREAYLKAISWTVRGEAADLVERGIPLDALNTNESADDVAALARALYGVDARVDLLGWSYGSHLAMTVLKRHESLITRAVLAAPEGPDQTYKRPLRIQQHLERLAERAGTGDLIATLARVLARLERKPVTITIHPEGLEGVAQLPYDIVIGRFDLEWIIAEGLADTRVLRHLPAWLARMDRGDFNMIGTERLLWGALEALRSELPYSVARYCMDCASGATAARREQIEREARETLLGRTIDFPFPEICEAVGCPDLGDEFRAPPRSQVPVLFITGTLDCRTPAENVAELSPGLPNHHHLVVEDAGHGDQLLQRRVQGAIAHFLAQGRVEVGRVHVDEAFVFEK